MAWLDDRAWCHPKLVNLTDRSYRVYINGISYAAGMGTGGTLTEAQQKLCGADYRARAALIEAGLWDASSNLAFQKLITIHDWNEHNGKRDARRKADRERKRIARGFEPKRPQDSPQDAPQDVRTPVGRTSTTAARAEGSEGSEKKELKDQRPKTTCPQCGQPHKTTKQLREHLTNTHWIENQDELNQLTGGLAP